MSFSISKFKVLIFIIVLFSIGCTDDDSPQINTECIIWPSNNPQEETGTITVNYNNEEREGTAGVLLNLNEDNLEFVTGVFRYCGSLFADPLVDVLYIPVTEPLGDTLEVEQLCRGDRCLKNRPEAGIISYSSDLFIASYNIDPNERSWIVVTDWDSETKRLSFNFELHFFRESVNPSYSDNEAVAPRIVALFSGNFDASFLEE